MSLSPSRAYYASVTWMSLVSFFTIFLLSLWGLVSIYPHAMFDTAPSNNLAQDDTEFSWDTLSPERELVWHKCFPGRQCARLIVPLNYSDPEGTKATIALVRKPSILPESSYEYRGPILFNPGGPGGSGVSMIQGPIGDLFSSVLGPQFDIVGFDPRGIGQSTPQVSLFNTPAERAVWEASDLHNAEGDIVNTWARALIRGQRAGEPGYGYLKHINTDQTARDMLRIVEAHGRTKIQYWGFSYGSVLGAAFASMFPDNVERLLIDGVVDSENYFAALWSNSLLDADKAMESFYTGCAEAGPDRCDFWAPSPGDIRQNLTNLYDSLRFQPVPVKTGSIYGYVDHKMLHFLVFSSLYTPFATYRGLAQGLAELAAGDGTTIYEMATQPPFECSGYPSTKETVSYSLEAQDAILCNDGAIVPADMQSTIKYFEMMSNTSEFGTLWARIRVGCAGWPRFSKTHFRGPFIANTSHPILLIGNTADPVTPLWAAHKMSRGYGKSVVLTQNSSGHSSVAFPSMCTIKYVQKYFLDGTLPNPGTICQVDLGPFDSVDLSSRDEQTQGTLNVAMNEEDRFLFGAIRELSSSSFDRFRLRFGNLQR